MILFPHNNLKNLEKSVSEISKKCNIIFVIDSPFPYYAGGIETWLFNVSSRLCENHNVTIISQDKTFYREPFFQLNDKINVKTYKTLHSFWLCNFFFRGKLRFVNTLGIIRMVEKILYRLVDNYAEHHVIALTTLFGATAAREVRDKRSNVRFICSARGPHAEIASKRQPFLSHYYEKMERRNLWEADLALSNGYDVIEYFAKKGISTKLMKNGIDTTRFYERLPPLPKNEVNPECFNIVSVATLLEIKGISEMIKATSLLVNRGYHHVILLLVGKGGQEKYKQQAKELGVFDNVCFLGHRSNVAPYLQQANVICCLSGGGGLSMSALESMASNRPVIAWDTPVYRQFNRDRKTMELVEEKNCERLADAIEQIMLYPEKCTRMTKDALLESGKYDWDIVVQDFENYLKLKV